MDSLLLASYFLDVEWADLQVKTHMSCDNITRYDSYSIHNHMYTYIYIYIILHPFYSMAIGPERRDGRRGVPRRNHFHFAMAEKQYEKVAEAAMAELEGGMCWPVEWFKEDLLEAQCSWTDSQRFLWNLTVFLYGIEFWLAAFGSKRHLFPSNFRRNWTHSWITSRGQLKPKMVLQWTCWSGGLSHEVWGLKSTNVPGRKNSGTGKMIHFLDWFLVPFFSGIWMSILGGVYGFSLFWRSSSPSWMDQTL